MAMLYRSPCFLLLPSRKLFFLKHEDFRSNFDTHIRTRRKGFRICACSAKKFRRRNKIKSNEELCDDIREFMSAVGLPEDHFPTMKEFSAHGRTDLANIVRRRGYKVVRDLLSNSIREEMSGINREPKIAEQEDGISHPAEGQDEKMEDIIENGSSNDVHIFECSIRADINSESGNCDYDHISAESSLDEASNAEWKTYKVKGITLETTSLTPSCNIEQNKENRDGIEHSSLSTPCDKVEGDDGEVILTVEDNSPPREVLIMVKFHGNLNVNSETNSDVISCIPEETSDSFLSKDKVQETSEGENEKANITAEDVSMVPGISYSEYPVNDINDVPSLNTGDRNSESIDIAANTSLEDKVAKFIQDGDLDITEDDVYGTLGERTKESGRFKDPETETEIDMKSPLEENFERAVIRSDAASASNGSYSEKYRLPMRANYLVREDDLAAEDVASSDVMKDVDDEIGKSENQVQVNRLKFLLHQKELELSHLKEQIEKEKISLSNLQIKTETEITKAQKFISEKEAELLAAEESLSGLVEVNIQYSGEGEIVEVAGSFNGWTHPIKMDPLPCSSNVDSTGSRKFRLWSTILWLYPGVYEIKFIVDGHWIVDEERESVARGGICNNILRVVR